MRRLPASRLLPRRVVEIHDDLPDLLLAQAVFPRRHDRVPGRRLLRQPGTALGDPPEEERFLEHRDRARVLEVRGRRVEAVGEVAPPVEIVAVTIHAVADVDLGARRDGFLEWRLLLAEWIVEPGDLDLLAAELDGSGPRRMHGAQLRRRLRLRRGLRVGVVAE